MSLPPDTPGDDHRPRPLLGLQFWAILLTAGICVAAGIAVATLGPSLPLGRG